MKYNKEWKRFMAMDHIDPSFVISYDKWKQRIKKPSTYLLLNWRLELFRQCSAIDEAIFNTNPITRCFRSRLSDLEKLKLCDLNRKTLYKVCKKIDKRLLKQPSGSAAKDWFSKALEDRMFKFLGCRELRIIRLMVEPEECPICFEDMDPQHVYVTRCCHVFCESCATKMWGFERRKVVGCPICRVVLPRT